MRGAGYHNFEKYQKIIEKPEFEKILTLSSKCKNKQILHVNSTNMGGGVAEILNRLVFLTNDLGIKTSWKLLKGSNDFFEVTKKIHNGLLGEKVSFSQEEKELYLSEIRENVFMDHFNTYDLVIIHDPQPLALIDFLEKKSPWIWRCHIDLHCASSNIWEFIEKYIQKYDAYIVTSKKYLKTSLRIPHFLVTPSIDPLAPKNIYINPSTVKKILHKNGIDPNKITISQISRFDKWKDPLGAIAIFEKVQKEIKNAQLVLLGDMALDDPEGPRIYEQIQARVKSNPSIIISCKKSDRLVNALQRHSKVILQNSIIEGFGLTITEALWKKTPVVAKKNFGSAMQIENGKTGFLIRNENEAAKVCVEIINNKTLGNMLGTAGKKLVKKHFLITKHLYNYLKILDFFSHKQ